MKTDRAILLTPPGAAAIAVVRLLGDRTAGFLRAHFSKEVAPGRAVHGTLSDGDRVIDDPLIVLHSGDEVHVGCADVSIHGGPWVVREVLELARREGFEISPVMQMPLPLDAVDGEDDVERQMLAHLPLAKTELALRCLVAQPAVWRRLNVGWALPTDSIAGRQERGGQCPPYEEEPKKPRHWKKLTPDYSGWWLLHPPGVAIIGAPNIGKSTLANQLFNQQRSITADVPGTTRDWVGEIADVDGLAVFLMDTPGMRVTEEPIERQVIAQSAERIRQADLIVLVVDGRQTIAEQRDWVMRYPGALVVRNFCDRATDLSALDDSRPHIHTVAASGEGVDSLRQAIHRHFLRPWRHANYPRQFFTPPPRLITHNP